MSLKLSDLPDINFVNADKETVTAQIINLYESTTGRTLGAGDPVRLFLLVIANVVILLLNKINYTGKQNLLAYANGTKLDHVAAMIGTARQEASKATLTETFTLSSTQASGTVIPAGTRVSAGDDTYFALVVQTRKPMTTIAKGLTTLRKATQRQAQKALTNIGQKRQTRLLSRSSLLFRAIRLPAKCGYIQC